MDAPGAVLARLRKALGHGADSLLGAVNCAIPSELLHLPGPDWVERVLAPTDRPIPVLRNAQAIIDAGRLGGTGHVMILSAELPPNPDIIHRDIENTVKLAIESGCSAISAPPAGLSRAARRHAHRIPFIVELPDLPPRELAAELRRARDMGAVGVRRIDAAQKAAREKGLPTLPPSPQGEWGEALECGLVLLGLEQLPGDFVVAHHAPERIGDAREQIARSGCGRAGLLHPLDGARGATSELASAVASKRAGAMGLVVSGRVLSLNFDDAVAVLHELQEVLLCEDIEVV